jgi:hypothetical protein
MTTRRQSTEVRAARAATLLDDPAIREVFDTTRNQIMSDIEACKLDGSTAGDAYALELVRKLQALLDVKRTILRPLIAQQMTENTAAR